MSTSNKYYTLYGAEISYFTGKVRAYFKWKGIPFKEVLSDASVYREILLPRVGFPVIPVVVGPSDETLQDSTVIIDTIESCFGEPSIYPSTPVQRLVALLLEIYGDEWLVIPAMHYRWHYNRDWAMQAFGEVNAPNATSEEQKEIGTKRAEPFAKAAELLGAEPHMHKAIERSYEDLLCELNQHFSQHPFLLGTRPSIGDFGLYGPLYAHLYRDPYSGTLMKKLAPNVVKWVERLRDNTSPDYGEFLPNDEIPNTLLPVLKRMMREQLPVLVDLSEKFQTWVAQNPNEEIPRVIGKHGFELEGEKGQRILRCSSLWMMQRARTLYQNLNVNERIDVDLFLEEIGGELFKGFNDPPRLELAGMSVVIKN